MMEGDLSLMKNNDAVCIHIPFRKHYDSRDDDKDHYLYISLCTRWGYACAKSKRFFGHNDISL